MRMKRLDRDAFSLLLSLCFFFCPLHCLPTVDPGLFVLQGVATCGEGGGYCLLGRACTLDSEFLPDESGHCEGVTKTFVSSASLPFVCCKYINNNEFEEEYVTTLSSVTIPDEKFQLLDDNPIPIIDVNNMTVPEDTSDVFEILGIVTDTTGILDLITRPYQASTTPNTTESLVTEATTLPVTEISTTLESSTVDATTPATLIPTMTNDGNGIDETTMEQDHIDETVSDNELKTINLSEEVQKYLAKRQDELSTKTVVPATDEDDDNLYSTFSPFTTNSPSSEDREDHAIGNSLKALEGDKKLIQNFILKATTHATTGLNRIQKPTHLKGNPLVPLSRFEDALLSGRNPGLHPTRNDPEISTEWTPTTTVTDSLLMDESTNFKSSLLQRTEGEWIFKKERTSGEENRVEEVILPHPVNLNICGLRRSTLQVSDHVQPASTYDWCWSAALMSKQRGQDKFECSGTLVELNLVITTAACLKRLRTNDMTSYRIVLGDSNLRDGLPYGVQYHDIDEIVTHPDYMTSGGAHVNDIGLIRLRSAATIDHNVCLACVSQPNAHISSESCVVSGYMAGNIPKDIRRDVEGFFPVEGVLRESPVTIDRSSKCHLSVQQMVPNPLLAANPRAFLCDVKEKAWWSCASNLDGGSPLVCKTGGRWFLTGISSWSGDCTREPHIYTRVNAFSEWFLNSRLRMSGFILAQLTPAAVWYRH